MLKANSEVKHVNQSFIQQLINYKINTLTADKLVQLAKDYHIQLTKREAKNVITILKTEEINLSNQKQLKRLLTKIKQEVSPKTMRQIQRLLNQLLSVK